MVWATIKKMPFPLHNREFVVHQVCCSDVNGDLLITTVPVDEVIDYGMKTNLVRGLARTLVRLISAGESQCKVVYYMFGDAGGRIPTFVVNAKLPLALGSLGGLRVEFQRDDEIDKLERDQLARVIKDEPQVYSEDEDSLIQRVQNKLGALKEENFEELGSPDHLVWMGGFFEGEEEAILRASTIVDASVEECAARELAKTSRAQIKSKKNLQSSLMKINDHQIIYHVVKEIKIPGFAPREFLSRVVWKKQGQTLVVVYESMEHEDFPANDALVRAESTTYLEYKTLGSVGETHQTRVTLTQRSDLKGSIPKVFMNKGGFRSLMHLSKMRQQFDKSLEIDGATRARNVEMITGHDGVEYSQEENRILTEGERHFTDFPKMNAKSLEMDSPLTTAKIAYKSGDRRAWGYATTTARASPEEVLAFQWDAKRRSNLQEDDLEKSVEERINGHNTLVYVKKRTPKVISDRDFLGRAVWKKEGDGFVYVTSPEESEARPMTDSVVRGKYLSAMRIARKNDKETTVTYVIHPDFGGPGGFAYLMNVYTASNLSDVTEIQEYFQALRGLEEFDADDARAVGEVMCIKTEAEKYPEKGENKQSARMRVLFKKHLSLSDIGRRYEFFEGMMARVVLNTLQLAGDVKSKLCSVSLKEGETIGRGLAMALASNLTAEAAVDEWILKHRSLEELDRTEAWFR